MRLFGRRATLTVDTIKIDCGRAAGLDIEFTVLKTWRPEANPASITIYNLSPDHRSQIRAAAGRGIRCTLEAGYEDTVKLYEGDFQFANVRREGPDVITEFSLRDGVRTTATNALNKSWAKGTPVTVVLQALADATGVGAGNLALAAAQIKKGVLLNSAFATSGPAYEALVKLGAGLGYQVSIQEGKFQFLAIGEGLPAVRATSLTPTSGLLGSPTVDSGKGKIAITPTSWLREPTAVSSTAVLRCRSLIQPGLDPGNRIHVESADIQGDFVVRKAKYQGSTFQEPWYIDLEAKPEK